MIGRAAWGAPGFRVVGPKTKTADVESEVVAVQGGGGREGAGAGRRGEELA
jgi:hypothetical protein